MKKILLVAVAVVFAGGCRGDGLLSPGVLSYSGTSRVVPDPFRNDKAPTVEATVLIANTTDRPLTFHYSHDVCDGARLRAFATPSMSGSPVWTSGANVTCALILYGPSTLDAGDTAQVLIYAPVSDILAAGLPGGTYYFDATLSVGGGDIRQSTVHVPAGTVFLSR
jgi:hypothetical protein